MCLRRFQQGAEAHLSVRRFSPVATRLIAIDLPDGALLTATRILGFPGLSAFCLAGLRVTVPNENKVGDLLSPYAIRLHASHKVIRSPALGAPTPLDRPARHFGRVEGPTASVRLSAHKGSRLLWPRAICIHSIAASSDA